MKEKEKITKNITIEDVISKYPKTTAVFFKYGFHCIGCPGAKYENLEQGARMHGVDIDKLINELNEAIKNEK